MARAGNKPAGWRPTWREPKKRRNPVNDVIARASARAREDYAANLPSDEELGRFAKGVLLALAGEIAVEPKDRVAAARALGEAVRPRDGGASPEGELADLMNGDPEAALRWMQERAIPALKARVTANKRAAKSLPPRSEHAEQATEAGDGQAGTH